MNHIARTLWDLIKPAVKKPAPANRSKRTPRPTIEAAKPSGAASAPGSMQSRYDELVDEMKRIHGIRVVKWRSSTSGCAWAVSYADGTTSRLIESPYPRGPMSCAVFMHEVGHHAIGLRTYRPRCLEEFHAWRWGLDEMNARGFNVTAAVLKRRDDALKYAVEKAIRRGLQKLPVELMPFLPEHRQVSEASLLSL